jgi:D-serine deaminase-like pyridoxal phosphate-dependent protein
MEQPAAAATERHGRVSGVTRDEIPTPALLLDLNRFGQNLAAMARHMAAAGKGLRPHAKTHKCPEIARRQIAAGAIGVVCAKLAEAEVMAAAGIGGLLISTEIVGDEKVGRLMRLLDLAPDVIVVVDNPEGVRQLARAAAASGHTLAVLVDVEVGGRRTGCQPGEPALALARAVMEAPALRFRGLQGYAGQCAHVVGWAARREASIKAMIPLLDTRRLLESNGIPVEITSGGSTGTYNIDSELPGMTELQCGSYCVMDLDYLRIGGKSGDRLTDFEMALTVLTTVVSVPAPDLAIVDGGFKAFATDRPFGPEAVEHPGVEYEFAGDEHGRLYVRDPARAPRLGDRIEFFPPHCDPTMNLYDRLYGVRGDRVEGVLDIAARGKSQ